MWEVRALVGRDAWVHVGTTKEQLLCGMMGVCASQECGEDLHGFELVWVA